MRAIPAPATWNAVRPCLFPAVSQGELAADSWRDNPLRFATKDDAIAYAYNLLMCRFLARLPG
jgi:hypothetical protein